MLYSANNAQLSKQARILMAEREGIAGLVGVDLSTTEWKKVPLLYYLIFI